MIRSSYKTLIGVALVASGLTSLIIWGVVAGDIGLAIDQAFTDGRSTAFRTGLEQYLHPATKHLDILPLLALLLVAAGLSILIIERLGRRASSRLKNDQS